ncbi:MAG: hypothetical protein FE78DRAFT_72197 [Acidomyces sp. 'richmondensis']|nr:MAG: hypothetical protein FE78DRAFT_72197 [Acidomyces sp. 'richmondensis']
MVLMPTARYPFDVTIIGAAICSLVLLRQSGMYTQSNATCIICQLGLQDEFLRIVSEPKAILRKHFDPLPPHILRQPAHHYVDLTLGPFALATDLLIGAKGIHFQLWPYITPSI